MSFVYWSSARVRSDSEEDLQVFDFYRQLDLSGNQPREFRRSFFFFLLFLEYFQFNELYYLKHHSPDWQICIILGRFPGKSPIDY